MTRTTYNRRSACAYCKATKRGTIYRTTYQDGCCDGATRLPYDSRVFEHGRPPRGPLTPAVRRAAEPGPAVAAPRRVERPVNGAQSKRKPYNGDAGYHCSLKTRFGHVVLYDRRNGGDWIDAGARWVLAAFDRSGANLALLDCKTERYGRRAMRDARDGWTEWIEWAAIRECFPDANVPRVFLEGGG